MSTEGDRTVRDREGTLITEGAPVVAWWKDDSFTATVKIIMPHRPGDGDFRRLVLVRDDDQAEVERDSDSIVVVVGDDETLPDTDLTAVVDTRGRDARAVIRLSGRAGLQPVDADEVSVDPFTQQVRDVLMAVPQVSAVAVVSTTSNRTRNIVVHWETGADRTVVGQRAWQALVEVLPDVQLRRAFWQ
jgi:enamine deaminase RidA (YjgF/YER057c/UK114 family)